MLHFFGLLSDPSDALDEWLRCKDDLLAGRPKPLKDSENDSGTLHVALSAFLDAKNTPAARGELPPVQFGHYKRVCETMIQHPALVSTKDRPYPGTSSKWSIASAPWTRADGKG